jgi:hypothetical protein
VEDILETSVGPFEVEYSFSPRDGSLSVNLYEFRDGRRNEDFHYGSHVADARDVRALFHQAEVPRDEAAEAARRVYADGVRWARGAFELYLVRIEPGEQRFVLEQPWPERFVLFNQWTAVRGERLLRVSAGSPRDDASSGIVVVSTASGQVPLSEIAKPSSWLSIDTYRAPGQHGRLAITEAADPIVTLEGRDASEWRFNVSQRRLRMISA